MIVLSGCASQKAIQTSNWHIEYLQQDLADCKERTIVYSDSLRLIRGLAIDEITKINTANNELKAMVKDFILSSEESIADSILKKYEANYKFPDGRTIGK